MRYIKTFIDNGDGSDMLFYIELNDCDLEERKIEIANGALLGYANKLIEYNGTTLDKNELLSLNEINELQGMTAVEIGRSEFETIWDQAVLAGSESKLN